MNPYRHGPQNSLKYHTLFVCRSITEEERILQGLVEPWINLRFCIPLQCFNPLPLLSHGC